MEDVEELIDGKSQIGCVTRPWRQEGIASAPWRSGSVLTSLCPLAVSEFESLASPYWLVSDTVLFTAQEKPSKVLFLLDGQVRLSLNSMSGKRLTLGIAEPGEVLGLAGAVSGCPYEVTAETRYSCRIAAFSRQSFIGFLSRYPAAIQNVARQLSLEHRRAYGQLSVIGFNLTAPVKLARLLLAWWAEAGGSRTEQGARIHCSMSHTEIGEYIGVARETVSRVLTDFKKRKLVERRGSSLIILSIRDLESYVRRIDD